MNLEYTIGVYSDGAVNHAIKAHVAQKQSPLLKCNLISGIYVLELRGLTPGQPEQGIPPDPHLDFYVRPDLMCQGLAHLPQPITTPSGVGLPTTYPWGTQHPAGAPIQSGHTIIAVAALLAVMYDMGQKNRITTTDARLNFDFEMSPYGVPQYHFGVDGEWVVKADKRIARTWAKIELDALNYAILYNALCIECKKRGLWP